MSPVTFANIRIQQEYEDLGVKRPVLRAMIDGFAEHALDDYGWIPCLDCILRTPDESREANASPPDPHLTWRAAQFKTRGVRDAIVDGMTRWANVTWKPAPATVVPVGVRLVVEPGVTSRG